MLIITDAPDNPAFFESGIPPETGFDGRILGEAGLRILTGYSAN
jgi:hypothetical protein